MIISARWGSRYPNLAYLICVSPGAVPAGGRLPVGHPCGSPARSLSTWVSVRWKSPKRGLLAHNPLPGRGQSLTCRSVIRARLGVHGRVRFTEELFLGSL
jgi:hypothetical protein